MTEFHGIRSWDSSKERWEWSDVCDPSEREPGPRHEPLDRLSALLFEVVRHVFSITTRPESGGGDHLILVPQPGSFAELHQILMRELWDGGRGVPEFGLYTRAETEEELRKLLCAGVVMDT